MSKKAPPKTLLTKIKQEVDRANNFIDYFLVIGVNPSICLNKQLFDHNVTVQKSIPLQPEILSKYPPFDKALVSIDDGIMNYCASKKFEVIEALAKPDEEIFSFILDNNFFSIEYPQKYVTCLRMYESLSSYKVLKEILEDKNALNNSISTSNGTSTDNGNGKDNSDSNYQNTISRSKSTTNAEDSNSRSIKRFCTLNENKKTNESLSGNMRLRLNTVRNQPMMKSRENFLFIPKVICLVSIYPFINQHIEILQSLYKYSLQSAITIPIEKYLLNLIIEVPVPPRGLSTVEYQLPTGKTPLTLSRSEMNKLPSIDFELEQICLCFKLHQIKTIFRHLLFETKIIFFSESINKLFHVILGFLTFLYPLKYPFQVASYVPEQNYSIIESISPYILGINQKYSTTFFKDYNLEVNDMAFLIVDIDRQEVIDVDNKEEFPKLPKNISNKLEKDIIELAGKWKGKLEVNKPSCNAAFNKDLCLYFFHCILGIMKNYAQYINNDYFTSHENIQNTNINTLFKVNEYVQSFPSSEQSFYSKFVHDSQMFSDFIYKKMIPKDNKEKLEILFLDESIQEQKWTIFDKKDSLFLLASEEYKIKNNYITPLVRTMNTEEIKAFKSQDLIDKMLNYAQVVTVAEEIITTIGPVSNNSKGNSTCNSNGITFDYPLFPMLNNEVFMSERSLSEYFILPSLNDELESINTEIVSKTYLSQIKVQNFEMENYLYLTWLQLWAFSFHYLDESEHEFRFGQMLNVLDKVTHHEIEIFNLLFDALKNKTELIVCLYKKLIVFKINPSCYIYSIISKIIDKEDMNLYKLKQGNVEKPQLRKGSKLQPEYQEKRKRSIRNAYEEEVLMDKVKFYPYYNCDECQTPLDLEKLSSNFSEMKRDIWWAYCPPCQKYILPKLQVRLGVELNIDVTPEGQTSTLEQVVLHSPYNLKINVKDGIYREYGLSLDIDQFKMKFTPLFWNAIWYFRILNLDYSFFIPYADSVAKLPQQRPRIFFKVIKSTCAKSIKRNDESKGSGKGNRKKKVLRYGNDSGIVQCHICSFELIQRHMKVVGHTSSSFIEMNVTESTFSNSNTNILDNSLMSDMSLSKLSMSDSWNDNESSCQFSTQKSMTNVNVTINKIIEERDREDEEELLDGNGNGNGNGNGIKKKCGSSLNCNVKQMMLMGSPEQNGGVKEDDCNNKALSVLGEEKMI